MAKAKEITGIDCAADALEWAGKVLRARFEEVFEQREAALDFSDIEGVHAMRVATRRLRSALRDFLPLMKKRPLKDALKNLKKIADALGAVRDQDVAMLALEKLQAAAEFEQTTEQIKEGIKIIREELCNERETAQADLTRTLNADSLIKLREDFTLSFGKALRKNKQSRAVSFNEAGRQAVVASLDELCNLGASFYEPFKIKKLHEMRIAAKRLRYAVELFTACWGERVIPLAAEIARMQSLLGEIHDDDVWLKNLGERLSDKKNTMAKQNELPAAIWLMSKFINNRTKNYCSALDLWGKWEATAFAERIRAVVTQNAPANNNDS